MADSTKETNYLNELKKIGKRDLGIEGVDWNLIRGSFDIP